MTVPETKEQLCSFLGLATFVGQRFIAHFSSLTAHYLTCAQSQQLLKMERNSVNLL